MNIKHSVNELRHRRRVAGALMTQIRRSAPEFGNKMPLWALQDLWGSPEDGDPVDNEILTGLEAVGELQFFPVEKESTLTSKEHASCIEHNGWMFGYVGIPAE